jgi:Tfp pilus assembly protein PilN
MRPINLASRPFRNERLPKVLLMSASLLVFTLTVVHGFAAVRLLPGNTSKLSQEVNALEEEGRKLREEGTRLRSAKPDPADAARWAVLKDLVDRKVFSWTRLLAILEESLPKGVRLVTVSPRVSKGQFNLNVEAIARTSEDGYELIRVLEERPEFSAVIPSSRTEKEGGVSFMYGMKYNPAAVPPPTPAPAASPSPEAVPGEAPPAAESVGGQP